MTAAAEIARPSFKHDLFSVSYPLFVTAAHAPVLLPELERRGAKLLTARAPTGVLLPDGRSLILNRSRESNVAAFDALYPVTARPTPRRRKRLKRIPACSSVCLDRNRRQLPL
jgi:hypothetical protein